MELFPENIKVAKGKISFIGIPSFAQSAGEFPICIWFEDILWENQQSELFLGFSIDAGFESPETVIDPFSYLENNFRLLHGNTEIIRDEDNSVYFGHRHNMISVEKINFGNIRNGFIETSVELYFDLESERVGKSFTKNINLQLEIKTNPEELTFA